jgi:uncharacterized lipoprotein YbaY
MKALSRGGIIAVVFGLLAVLPGVALAANVTIQGNVAASLSLGRPVGNNSTLFVRLDNVTTGTAVPVTNFQSQGIFPNSSQPQPYTINVDSSQLSATQRYRVVAEIVDPNNNRLYRGVSSSFSVPANANATVPLIQATPSYGRLGDPSSGMWRIVLAVLLVAGAAGIALLRRSRTQRLAMRPV